ncbi:hypothetical protein ABZT06_49370 [Streptomyces sp. NPDC005483]
MFRAVVQSVTMACCVAASVTWFVALVRAGTRFERGRLVERPEEAAA